MFTQITFVVFCVLILIAGFLGGREYQYEIMMRRLREVAKEVKPCCGNCKEYNGDFCTIYWNNLDECYKDTERDARDPEDPACEYYEFDEDWVDEE